MVIRNNAKKSIKTNSGETMEVSDDHPDLVEMGLSLLGYFNSSAVPPQWPQIDERSNPQFRIFHHQNQEN